jgi:mRNA interferase MazF
MADICPGDVYYVEIPPHHVVGREQFKTRPFVIVSRLRVNRSGGVIVGVPFTSSGTKDAQPPYRIFIPKTEIKIDFAYRGTPIVDSIALTDQVRAIDPKRLRDKVGVLSATGVAAIGLGLAYLFDLR